jgi:hypothetical protein
LKLGGRGTGGDLLVKLAQIYLQNPKKMASGRVLLREVLKSNSGAGPRNSLAWSLYSSETRLAEAEELARAAHAIEPEDMAILQTLVAVLVRERRWDQAQPLFRTWIVGCDLEQVTGGPFKDYRMMFHDMVRNGYAIAAATVIDQGANLLKWRVISAALREAAGAAYDEALRERQGLAVTYLARQFMDIALDAAFPTL